MYISGFSLSHMSAAGWTNERWGKVGVVAPRPISSAAGAAQSWHPRTLAATPTHELKSLLACAIFDDTIPSNIT